MLRNTALSLDPEASPVKGSFFGREPPSPSDSESDAGGDPWYAPPPPVAYNNNNDSSNNSSSDFYNGGGGGGSSSSGLGFGLNNRGGARASLSSSSSSSSRGLFGGSSSSSDANIGGGGGGGKLFDYDDEDVNELPLLEELGINFVSIWRKTQAVMDPRRRISEDLFDDADLAGPLLFCLALGSFMFIQGKFQAFGYLYGFSLFGCSCLYMILSLLNAREHTQSNTIDFWLTCSVLGYCLLPVIALGALSVLVSLKGVLGLVLAVCAIGWSSFSATRMFDAKMNLTEQYWLVMYPVVLLFSCFVLITIF